MESLKNFLVQIHVEVMTFTPFLFHVVRAQIVQFLRLLFLVHLCIVMLAVDISDSDGCCGSFLFIIERDTVLIPSFF